MRTISHIFLLGLLLIDCNAFSCMIMQNNADEPSSYLDKIDKKPEPKIKKLVSIRNNISKFLKDTNKKEDISKIEKGHISTYQPIPQANFDTIFLNIYNISKLYMSYNVDRIIFEMQTGRRYVFYISKQEDRNKMDNLMKLIPNKIKILIINDVKNTMDDPFGYLYCAPKQ
jgi:hypothetical protein